MPLEKKFSIVLAVPEDSQNLGDSAADNGNGVLRGSMETLPAGREDSLSRFTFYLDIER